MAKRNRIVVTPAAVSDFSVAGAKAFWKQIIPQKRIDYTTRSGKKASIDFTEDYIGKLIADFSAKGVPTKFVLADKDNAHTMDPERVRGSVTELRMHKAGEKPGLYGKVVFGTNKMAKAVTLTDGDLPVSARIREDENGPTLVHVLGTLDPQVPDMEKWHPADLSVYDDKNVLDLSNSTYVEGETVAKKIADRELDSFDEAEINAFTDEQLDEFMTKFAPEFDKLGDDEDDDDADDEDDDDSEDEDDEIDTERVPVGAGAELSKTAKRDIELANSAAQVANSRANEALQRMAAAEFREYKAQMISDGVPPHLLDLAEPVLNRPDDMVIDLSNTGDEDVNASEIVRKFIDAAKGTIDTDVELGHAGNFNNGDGTDPDEAALASWEING
jgi:hypothetical protein